ncbi:hypothetical protein Tco_0594848 [Tanacetum coccineum]
MIYFEVMTILMRTSSLLSIASPPDAEIVSLEVVEIVIREVGGMIRYSSNIKDDILREKISAQVPLPFCVFLPDYEAFYSDEDHIKEKE